MYAKMEAEAKEIKRKIEALEKEKQMLKDWKPKKLPVVRSCASERYIFAPPTWKCSRGSAKTLNSGEWQCGRCDHWQKNRW